MSSSMPGARYAAFMTAAQEKPDEVRKLSSLIGIITAIVGNVIIALAFNVQRYAHTRLHHDQVRLRSQSKAALDSPEPCHGVVYQRDEMPTDADAYSDDGEHEKSTNYLKSPYWWLGQVLIWVGETGNFLAYGFASASIVSPLGVVSLIANCIIAPILFHERFRYRDFCGVVVAVAGVVTVVLSANQQGTRLGPHEIWDAIVAPAFEIYMAVSASLLLLLLLASLHYGKSTIFLDLCLAGLIGGYTVLATKGISSMLSSSLFRAFTTPITYVLMLVLVITGVLQVRYINRALQKSDSTQVIPIHFVSFTLWAIIGSAVLYRDFERTTVEQAVKFGGGCLLTFFGVFLITSGRPPKDENIFYPVDGENFSEVDGAAETIGLDQQSSYTQSVNSPSRASSRHSSQTSRMRFASVSPSPVRILQGPATLAAASKHQSHLSESAPLLGEDSWPGFPVHLPNPSSLAPASPGLIHASTGPSTATAQVHLPPSPSLYTRFSTLISYPSVTPPTSRHASLYSPRYTPHGPAFNVFLPPSPLSSTVSAVQDALLGQRESGFARRPSLRRVRSCNRPSNRASPLLDDQAVRYADLLAGDVRVESHPSLSAEVANPDNPPAEQQFRRLLGLRSVSDALAKDLLAPGRRASKGLSRSSSGPDP